MKNQVRFKAGDRVYCPHLTSNILRCVCSENSPNLLAIEYHNKLIDITADGKFWDKQGLVNDVFPATQEWYELLSRTYPNVTFEPPPKRKEPKEVIKAMLKAGYDGVPCKTECGRDRYICTGIVEDEFYSFQYDSDDDNAYSSGIPYHPKTGLKIVDFIDGKCVLENGEVVLEN